MVPSNAIFGYRAQVGSVMDEVTRFVPKKHDCPTVTSSVLLGEATMQQSDFACIGPASVK